MHRSLGLLGSILIISMIAQPAMAERFIIYVSDANNIRVEEAQVGIWKENALIHSGLTDNEGFFSTYLNIGTVYTIKAEKYNLAGETTLTANLSVNNIIKVTIVPR